MDDITKRELQGYIDDLIKLGLRPFYAEIFLVAPLFEDPIVYDRLLECSLKYMRDLDMSDDARFLICTNFDYSRVRFDSSGKGEIRRIIRKYWNELAEVYSLTPSEDFRRKIDTERQYSRVKWNLPFYMEKEFESRNIDILLGLIRDQRNGDSRERLLNPLKRRKRSKWVQEFLKTIVDDPDIGEVANEILSSLSTTR